MKPVYDQLRQIAAERSSERRVELLHRITDLFLEAGGGRTDAEAYLFNDIMEKIVDQISRDAKIQVSANLATLPGFPAGVVRKLAGDADLDIARPALRGSPALSDDDLVGIAKTGQQGHLHAIAARDSLSSVVTDVLIDRGDDRVVHRVSSNHGAQFSNWGFEKLFEKAAENVDLQEALVERPDLGQAMVERLLPLVSQALALKLVERGFDVGAAIPADIARIARERFAEALRDRRANIRGVSALIELVTTGDLTLDQATVELVAGGRLLDIATLFTRFAKISTNDVFSIFTRGQLQILLVLFRALDLKWATLDKVLALRAQKLRMPNPASDEVARDYEALDKSLAMRALRFFQVRCSLGANERSVPAA